MEDALAVLCPLCGFVTLLVLGWYILYGFPRVLLPWLESIHVPASHIRFTYFSLAVLYLLSSCVLNALGATGGLGSSLQEQAMVIVMSGITSLQLPLAIHLLTWRTNASNTSNASWLVMTNKVLVFGCALPQTVLLPVYNTLDADAELKLVVLGLSVYLPYSCGSWVLGRMLCDVTWNDEYEAPGWFDRVFACCMCSADSKPRQVCTA